MEVGKITHSHSQPGGMDRTPPGTPKKGGKMLAVRVQMLDDSITMFQVQAKALGRVLFDQVCNQLHLLESDYFGLEYQETGGTKYWLDLEKPLSRQIGLSLVDTLVRFCVKFYTPDPSQLEEEFTRYLFCLQIKRDLSQGLLQCNNNTAALMASYIVQAECGDYVVEDYPDHRYLSSYKFVPNQDQELERRIMENHKKHAGQSPAEADLNLLETARRCELYGIKMHPAKDHEGVPLNLAVAHMGIVVFQNFLKINTFSWAKMRKISFKRKKFLVKLHPEGYGYYKDTVEFFFEGRNECKNFWKKCVENHGFFRCTMVKKVPRQKTRVLSRGSSFRYSGRTQKQIVDFVRENYVKRQTFQRSQSFRHSSSAHSSVANVGTSISAHPLLPLGDNAVAGTPASLSCGSMTLTSSPVHTADIHAGGSPSPPLTTSVSPGTSVTSSPQHFYPQETPYRRAGHQPTKVKHPHVRSHRAISPLHSPTDAVVAASNRSANLSNSNHANNGINNVHGVDNGINSDNINNGNAGRSDDGRDSRSSLQSPEFTDFNEVYSNCYAFLRDSRNGGANEVASERGAKNEGFDSSSNFVNATSKSNESIRSSGKRTVVCGEKEDADRYTWHRSASCRDLYHEENLGEERNGKKGGEVPVGLPPEPSSLKQCDRVRRKCYSAVASKNPSVERAGDLANEVRIYPSSYPGTTSSLSTESADGELDERIMEALDAKYDSQEEMVLSHDDVSHDSYELLERELDDYNGDGTRNKSDGLVGESERRRSCSWGSDRAIASLDFRSTENVLGAGSVVPGEESFWSLERERSSKHKSEIDFRSFSHRGSRGGKRTVRVENRWRAEGRDSGRPEIFDREGRIFKRNWEEDGFKGGNRTGRGFRSRNAGEPVEFCGALGQEFRLEGEDFESLERKRYSGRRKSLEELAMFPMELEEVFMGKPIRVEERRRCERRREKRERDERFHEGLNEKEQKDWMRGVERRAVDRRKSLEEKQAWAEEEVGRKILQKPNDYANFQEIHFKKFDRVVSNQFGKYSEFLSQENAQDFLAEEEKKVIENYEKVCQVSKMAKELKRNEAGFLISGNSSENGWRKSLREAEEVRISPELDDPEECEERIIDRLSLTLSPKASFKTGKAIVERTKSDPYNSIKNQRRSLLMHQKSIDLTPQQSEETVSDYDNEDAFKKTSRSEHDIPYILHKRHCMNGTARVADFVVTKKDLKMAFGEKPIKSVPKEGKVGRKSSGETPFKVGSDEVVAAKSKPSSVRVADAKKAGVKIINLDVRHGKAQVNVNDSKKAGRVGKPPATKKSSPAENKPASPKRVTRKVESTESGKRIKNEAGENRKGSEGVSEAEECSKEPIYAEVCREKIVEGEELSKPEKTTPPEPPKRTTSVAPKSVAENKISAEKDPPVVKSPGYLGDLPEVDEEKKAETPPKVKKASEVAKVKQDLPPVLQRREESLILFARTRLGLSEGSAFAPIVRQGRVGSPATQRRTKSLDSPYVSVHSLPPADAFSSKDDTVDETEDDVVGSAVARIKELTKTDSKPGTVSLERKPQNEVSLEPPASTESELDSVFAEDLEIDNNFKKIVENQSKVEISLTEEKVLDGVRNKRLLSKIESVDFIDSEGDLDSSKQTESVPIPSDRLVNLPESIRFPSVRQISGQTSEESADGWDQREVKVKRRTPRRSVGREDQDVGTKESVVWDSKDDEPPDDDVWDDGMVQPRKYEGSVVNVGLPVEYLKRGSCGQSIDDDNLSTPMKESSPEHWVSVDDLPEALEREEKLLRQQEKILKEKILNEKLKRELNLDTIEERYCDYREAQRQQRYEEESISFKGHSLDTYELTEKKLRERGGNKNSSLDEHLLGEKSISGYLKMEAKGTNYQEGVNYIQCKVVNDVAEIDQFGDNDDELEEFFVVLDENLRIGKEEGEGEVVWEEEDSFGGGISNEEILMSVPEEFKDAEKEGEGNVSPGKVEIRLSEVGGRTEESEREEEKRGSSFEREEGLVREDAHEESKPDLGRLSPYGGSRRGSEEQRKPSLSEDTGRLSPYDNSSRRSSVDPRRLSASEEPGRLSPFNDSRRGSEDPRRLSTSEDSRKYSMSESVSEETRRRLSSTEETRRKRASLTKQCSVGAESLSDEIISGIQECSSSFEQDEEKDVFEPEVEKPEAKPHRLEIEVSEDTSNGLARSKSEEEEEEATVGIGGGHLAPPTSERELSRETEDSVDYGEGDLKEMREAVKEKDISEGLICDHESLKSVPPKSGSSLEKSESSEGDELRYIDEKRGSTPEIIVGKSKESVAMSIVVVNEGISVLKRITENDQRIREAATETRSLPRKPEVPEKDSLEGRHTFPKSRSVAKPKPVTPPKPVLDSVHRKLTKATVGLKGNSDSSKETSNLLKSSLDSSQESDIDKLSDYSLISHVQSQIARRNLSDAGKCLRLDAYEVAEKENRKTSSEEDGFALSQRTSSEEREKTESSSFEMKSSADEGKGGRGEKRTVPKSGVEARKREAGFGTSREKRSPEQEKRDSGEDGSSSSSAPVYPKRELSSTWKPFLLESSGSSSLEEGWLPPDENAHLADEEETSSTSNNQQDDSYHEDVDYATGFGYPVLNMSSAEMMVGGYGSVYALSRTLSRISERSTSEQERSDLEDDITKPSSHSVSAEEESILSSDHQPSLSSDPPSPKESSSRIPDLPVDKPTEPEEKTPYEPFPGVIPPPVPEDDWPSPPSSSSVADTPVVSHIETFYIEIHPEEARKVVVATEPPHEEGSSSDENQTLQEESEFLHLSSENVSASTTTTTTQDGTVVFAVRPKTGRTGSASEDASLVSSSEWSTSVPGARHRSGSSHGGAEEVSDRAKETGGKIRFKHEDQSPSRCPDPVVYVDQDGTKSRIGGKIKPLKLTSPTGKTFGFFETPISKVRSPTSQRKFIETGGGCSRQSPTSFSETASPKSHGRFFEGGRSGRSPTKGKGNACTPYYSNVAESAEKSYFGRYDTGSLERTKIHSSRKCFSYYSVSRTVPHEGDSSNSDGAPAAPSPNTIPRASKKIKRRHRVAMDLVVRDGKIVAPPKTKATVVENSDSDRSSPREFRSREGGREGGRRKHSDV